MAYRDENTNFRLLKILRGEASEQELVAFEGWLEEKNHREDFDRMKKLWNLTAGPKATEEELEKELLKFRQFIHHQNIKRKRKLHLQKIGWAAVILLLLSVGGIYRGMYTAKEDLSAEILPMADIIPGTPKAVLVTADGREVALTPEKGQIVKIDENNYVRTNDGTLVYTPHPGKSSEVRYNRLTVPRGGEFNIVLSDGTEVVLNSKTELNYPVVFEKDKRVVSLNGEAYFKVKKDGDRPFYVEVNNVTIRVYGTSFNVNAYDRDHIRTVLVEGSIGIRGKGEEYRMKPLQMAEFSQAGELRKLETVDIRPYVAWKDGLFLFENQSLEEIMNTLSLWYDVDVFYASEQVKNYHFTGSMQRYEQVDRILNAITKMVGVHFKVMGKTIVVDK